MAYGTCPVAVDQRVGLSRLQQVDCICRRAQDADGTIRFVPAGMFHRRPDRPRDRTDVDRELAAAPRRFARTPTSSSIRATTAAVTRAGTIGRPAGRQPEPGPPHLRRPDHRPAGRDPALSPSCTSAGRLRHCRGRRADLALPDPPPGQCRGPPRSPAGPDEGGPGLPHRASAGHGAVLGYLPLTAVPDAARDVAERTGPAPPARASSGPGPCGNPMKYVTSPCTGPCSLWVPGAGNGPPLSADLRVPRRHAGHCSMPGRLRPPFPVAAVA